MNTGGHFIGYLETRSWRYEELKAAGAPVQLYTLLTPLTFVSKKWGPLTAQAGMTTDMASIPRYGWGYVAPNDPCMEYSAPMHDAAYLNEGWFPELKVPLIRAQADDLLIECMEACGARPDQCLAVRWALRLFGASHWGKQ